MYVIYSSENFIDVDLTERDLTGSATTLHRGMFGGSHTRVRIVVRT